MDKKIEHDERTRLGAYLGFVTVALTVVVVSDVAAPVRFGVGAVMVAVMLLLVGKLSTVMRRR